MSCRVFLLDDQDAVRGGLRRLIEATEDLTVVGESATVEGALDRIRESQPDVAILDIRLPDGNGADVGREIRENWPGVRCLMLTACPDEEAFLASVEARAAGYLCKPVSGPDLRNAIRWAASGDPSAATGARHAGPGRRGRGGVVTAPVTGAPHGTATPTPAPEGGERRSRGGGRRRGDSPDEALWAAADEAGPMEEDHLARLLAELGIA